MSDLNERKEEAKRILLDYIKERFPWSIEQGYTGTTIHRLVETIATGEEAAENTWFDIDYQLYLFLLNRGDVLRQYWDGVQSAIILFAGGRARMWEELRRDEKYIGWRWLEDGETPPDWIMGRINSYREALAPYDEEADMKVVRDIEERRRG